MRIITELKKHKQTYNLPESELRTGEWCKNLMKGEFLEINWKKGYLTVQTAEVRGAREVPAAPEEDTNDNED